MNDLKPDDYSDQPQSNSSGQSRRLLIAINIGWQSAKANVLPGLVIVLIAALIVVIYYQLPVVNDTLNGLVNLRQQLGIWFSMAASAFGAGLIPGLYMILTGRSRHGLRVVLDLLFTCIVWAITAVTLDRFYVVQAWLWGTAVTLQVLLVKMLVDQLIFTPLVGVQIPALGSRLRDMNYDLRSLGRAIRGDWLIGVTIPMLVPCWLTWIPGSLVIYALPLPLQIPMMVLIQCFFALEVAYASSKM
jgi:hypothetical protein